MAQPHDQPLNVEQSELAPYWPSEVTVKLVSSENLVDPQSPLAPMERNLAKGKTTVVAEVELFPGTPHQRVMKRKSAPTSAVSPAVYQETVNQLVVDVRRALEEWRRTEAPETLK